MREFVVASPAQGGPPTHCLHGVHLRTSADIDWWPRCSAPVARPWELTIDPSGADLHLAGLVRAGAPQWAWTGLPAGSERTTQLLFSGGDGMGSARRFVIDWEARTICVTLAQPHPHRLRGTLDLVARWVLPLIARVARTVLPVHATSLVVDGRALVVMGASGAGKSTVTAALGAAGATVLGDEPVLLEPTGEGVDVWPGEPVLRLLPATTAMFGNALASTRPARAAGKVLFGPSDPGDGSTSVPLLAVCVLGPRHDGASRAPSAFLMEGPRAFMALAGNGYAQAQRADLARSDFEVTAAVVERAPVVSVSMPNLSSGAALIDAAAKLPEIVTEALGAVHA